MGGAVVLDLLDRCGCMIHDAAPTRRLTIFVHPDSTTRVCRKLDVIFSLAGIVNPGAQSGDVEKVPD